EDWRGAAVVKRGVGYRETAKPVRGAIAVTENFELWMVCRLKSALLRISICSRHKICAGWRGKVEIPIMAIRIVRKLHLIDQAIRVPIPRVEEHFPRLRDKRKCLTGT